MTTQSKDISPDKALLRAAWLLRYAAEDLVDSIPELLYDRLWDMADELDRIEDNL